MPAQIIEALPGFTFGCDPELFVVNGDGEFVTAEGLLPGTKEEPFKVEGGAVQVDGMAAEFNINPASNFPEFNANIVGVLQQLRSMLPPGHTLKAVPAATFSDAEWSRTPDIAKVLGCTPDFNAWTGKVNPPPNPEGTGNPQMRTASGHLHIGWTEDADTGDIDYVNNCRDVVKQLDYYLGGWSINRDSDSTRRSLYGQAGAMRFKPYGVEYRVLSNFWLKDKDSRLMVWNRMQKAIHDMRSHFLPDNGSHFNDLLIKSINTTTVDDVLFSIFKTPLRLLGQ